MHKLNGNDDSITVISCSGNTVHEAIRGLAPPALTLKLRDQGRFFKTQQLQSFSFPRVLRVLCEEALTFHQKVMFRSRGVGSIDENDSSLLALAPQQLLAAANLNHETFTEMPLVLCII